MSKFWMSLSFFLQSARNAALPAILVFLAVTASSADARTLRDVEYSHPDGKALTLDGYIPDGEGPFPAVLIVHGGAWVAGDKTSIRPLIAPLEKAGFAWFSIDYRLAKVSDLASLLSPQGLSIMTSASNDVRAAIQYLKKSSPELQIDPQRIALIGESAGAHLAELAALSPGEEGAVAGVVGFFGPSDLVSLAQTSDRIPQQVRSALEGTALGRILTATLQGLSPRFMIGAAAPPFLLLHGTRDNLVPMEQSVEMCQALEKAGTRCELFIVEGGTHGLHQWERNAAMTAYKDRLVEWLRGIIQN